MRSKNIMGNRIRLSSIVDLSLPDGVDSTGMTWPGERCKGELCRGRRCVVTIVVRDEDWNAVVDGEGILCPVCFDIEAQRRGVKYEILSTNVVKWHEWDEREAMESNCRYHLDRGDLLSAAKALSKIPKGTWTDETHRLSNILNHRREAEWLEASLFPETLEFNIRWEGPHLGDGRKPESWFPGRVVSFGETETRWEVELELGEPPPPKDPDDPNIFGLSVSLDCFRKEANLEPDAMPVLDQMLELHVYSDGTQRIFFHPLPSSENDNG